MYTKLHMLHTKISSKLCDFASVCCCHTRVHACFQTLCHTNLSYYRHISFCIVTLAAPSDILYTITTETKRSCTVQQSTNVGTLESFLRYEESYIFFQNKYSHWQHVSQTSMQNNIYFLLCHIKI